MQIRWLELSSPASAHLVPERGASEAAGERGPRAAGGEVTGAVVGTSEAPPAQQHLLAESPAVGQGAGLYGLEPREWGELQCYGHTQRAV